MSNELRELLHECLEDLKDATGHVDKKELLERARELKKAYP